MSHFKSRLLLPLAVLALGALPVALASAATPKAGEYHGFANNTNPTGPLPCGHDESEAWFHATKSAITPPKKGTCGLPDGAVTSMSFPNEFGCSTGNALIRKVNKIKVSGGKFDYSGTEKIGVPGGTNIKVTIIGKWVSATKVKGTTKVKRGSNCTATTKWTMVKAPA